MKAERGLAADGELRGGSNIGKGQIRAADYMMVPDVVSQNDDASGNRIGGLIGGLIGDRTAAAVIGGVNIKRKTRSEAHTYEIKSLIRTSFAVFLLKKTKPT